MQETPEQRREAEKFMTPEMTFESRKREIGYSIDKDAALNDEEKNHLHEIASDLFEFGAKYGLRGLEGRMVRGLDPSSVLALKETVKEMETVATKLNVPMEEVIKLTNSLHVGAIWENAKDLKAGEKPEVKAWMIAAEAGLSEGEQEGELDLKGFLKNVETTKKALEKAAEDPAAFAELAHDKLVKSSQEKFNVENGVPISEVDAGFLAMAVNGYEAGIVRASDGLIFVGTDNLDFSGLAEMGLEKYEKEDRGAVKTFYKNAEGKDVVKVVYGGLAIVFNGDIEVAKRLAKTRLEKGKEQKA